MILAIVTEVARMGIMDPIVIRHVHKTAIIDAIESLANVQIARLTIMA